MANPKKNTIFQFLTVLTDKTDFASIESGVTSNFTQRLWGVRNGTSAAATAKTPSKLLSVVRSGVFRVTLKSTEVSTFDQITYELEHASGATQLMQFMVDDYTTSDVYSLLSDTQSKMLVMSGVLSDVYSGIVALSDAVSNTYSAALLGQSLASDAASGVTVLLARTATIVSDISDILSGVVAIQGASYLSDVASAVWANAIGTRVDSRILVAQSMISDIDSALTSRFSDLLSLVNTTGIQLNASSFSDLRSAIAGLTVAIDASAASDIASAVWAHVVGTRVDSRVLLVQSRISDAQSMLSDLLSDFQSRVPKAVATNSQLSDLHSDLRSYLVGMSGMLSDVDSALTSRFSDLLSLVTTTGIALDASTLSDLRSAIAGLTVSIDASAASDIASAVWAHTTGARVDSRLRLAQSDASDASSGVTVLLARTATLVSDISDLLSGVVALQGASYLSDVASAVWANAVGTRVDSRLLVIQSLASDIDSALTSRFSDLLSLVTTTGVQMNASSLSDLRSAIAALTVSIDASAASDIASAVWAHAIGARVDSRILLNQSMMSDTYSLLSDLRSDFQSRVPKAVATNSQLSDLHSDLRSFLAVMSGIQSDVYSALSDLQSDFQSRVPKRVATDSQLSDLHSDLKSYLVGLSDQISDLNSDMRSLVTTTGVQLNASSLSDLRSAIAALTVTIDASAASDIASAVWAHTIGTRVDSRVLLTQSMASDAASAAIQANSRVLLNQSRISDLASYLVAMSDVLSDFYSDFQSRVPKRVATDSQLSDLASDLLSYLTGLSGLLSDVDSALTSRFSDLLSLLNTTGTQLNASSLSDLRSAIAGITATLSTSDISDIASAVRANLASDLSDILSGVAFLQNVSHMSDIASAVWAHSIGVRVDSRMLVIQSQASDTYSLAQLIQSLVSDVDSALSSRFSDLLSLVTLTGVQLNASSLSDLRSAIAAGPAATITGSDISDIVSAVWAAKYTAHSGVSSFGSLLSDVYSRLQNTQSAASDTYSLAQQINSRLNLTLSMASDIDSALTSRFSDLMSLLVTTGIALDASTLSDLRSAIAIGPTAGLTLSDISDVVSAIWGYPDNSRMTTLNPSDLSMLRSAITVAGTLATSTMSDIASQVWGHAVGTRLDSRVALVQSAVSDIGSQVWADTIGARVDSRVALVNSGVSDIYSLLGTVGSAVSDLDSALTSQFTYESAVLSDLYSNLSDFKSDFQSRVPGRVLVRADTMAELAQAVPPANPTQEMALMAMFMGLRNKTKTTSTEREWFNDAGSMIVRKPIQASGGSYLESEMLAGI